MKIYFKNVKEIVIYTSFSEFTIFHSVSNGLMNRKKNKSYKANKKNDPGKKIRKSGTAGFNAFDFLILQLTSNRVKLTKAGHTFHCYKNGIKYMKLLSHPNLSAPKKRFKCSLQIFGIIHRNNLGMEPRKISKDAPLLPAFNY